MFKILGVDHIGVAVSDLKETQNFWTTALGLDCTGEEVVSDQKVKTSFNVVVVQECTPVTYDENGNPCVAPDAKWDATAQYDKEEGEE